MTGPAKRNAQASRRQRLSVALRENLKRRKAQAKERTAERTAERKAEPVAGQGTAAVSAEDEADPHDSAGIVPDKRTR